LPALSAIRKTGWPPSLPPVKEYSTVSVPLGESLNTTPHPEKREHLDTPPPAVVP
jgi:hypothetical protein